MVVRKLVATGVPVVAMVRNAQSSAAKALAELPAPAGLELVEATLTGSTHAELESLVAGCSVCICCSGTERITKAADIFGGGLNDPSHPYNVNYRGIEALCSAMKAKGCGKIVRITGSALGKSVFYPFSTLLNVVLSMATKWQNHGEAAIRASGLNYTMIRPPALVDAPRGRPGDVHLMLTDRAAPGSGGTNKVSREDVADLIVAAYNHPACNSATLECKWGRGPSGPQEWPGLLDNVRPDDGELEVKPFRLALAVYLVAAAGMLLALAGLLRWLAGLAASLLPASF